MRPDRRESAWLQVNHALELVRIIDGIHDARAPFAIGIDTDELAVEQDL